MKTLCIWHCSCITLPALYYTWSIKDCFERNANRSLDSLVFDKISSQIHRYFNQITMVSVFDFKYQILFWIKNNLLTDFEPYKSEILNKCHDLINQKNLNKQESFQKSSWWATLKVRTMLHMNVKKVVCTDTQFPIKYHSMKCHLYSIGLSLKIPGI